MHCVLHGAQEHLHPLLARHAEQRKSEAGRELTFNPGNGGTLHRGRYGSASAAAKTGLRLSVFVPVYSTANSVSTAELLTLHACMYY